MHRLPAQNLALLAAAGSALLLAAAFAFQAAGYAPCELCILQRWPHGVAVLLGLLAWLWGAPRPLLWLGAATALTAMGLGGWHAGIEWGWWPGPAACTGGLNLGAISTADLLAQIEASTEVVRCDQPALTVMGLSMAGMNAIASAILAAIWIAAARR